MAILQLSRITHRKGLDEDLPQLAGAELGWVLDNRKLYIGNGDIVDGAPVVGNTEILTEFSDVLGLSSTYTYKGADAGYVVETGPAATSILRSMQSKFDDFVSVKDFGAFGDSDELGNGTDDTDAINRALYELFCQPEVALNSENNPQARRSLYFPAGIYKVTGKIKVPPHAKLWGEGLTSSIIKFFRADDISVTDIDNYLDSERYQISFVGTTTFPGGLGVDDIYIAGGVLTGTGLVRPVPAVVETADSGHFSGLQIGGNGDQLPTGIEMMSMSIETTEENSLLKLNSVSSSGFSYLGLTGPRTDTLDVTTLPTRPEEQTSAVEIVGAVHDVTISKLNTSGTTYGLKAEGETKGVVLENSGLDLHYKGVYLTNPLISANTLGVGETGIRYKIIDPDNSDFTSSGAEYNREGETFIFNGTLITGQGTVISMDDPGPTGVVVSRNIFDQIAREGVHFENVLFNSSGFNVFYNVANDLGATAQSPVITLETDECLSIGDLFEREDESVHPRVALDGNGGIYIDCAHSIHLGAYERQVGIAAILEPSQTDEPVFAFDETEVNSYRVDYSITRNMSGQDETRMGRLYVSNNGGAVTYNDEYTESALTGIVLSVTSPLTNTSSEVQFTSDAEPTDATMTFSVVRLD